MIIPQECCAPHPWMQMPKGAPPLLPRGARGPQVLAVGWSGHPGCPTHPGQKQLTFPSCCVPQEITIPALPSRLKGVDEARGASVTISEHPASSQQIIDCSVTWVWGGFFFFALKKTRTRAKSSKEGSGSKAPGCSWAGKQRALHVSRSCPSGRRPRAGPGSSGPLPLLLQLETRLLRPLQRLLFRCSEIFQLGEQEQSPVGIPIRSGGSLNVGAQRGCFGLSFVFLTLISALKLLPPPSLHVGG